MYVVEVRHHKKAWRNGDLEDELVLEGTEHFKTKTAAKIWVKDKLCHLNGTKREEWHKGDKPSYAYCWTGVTWQHENSGEQMEEYYQYTIKKVKA